MSNPKFIEMTYVFFFFCATIHFQMNSMTSHWAVIPVDIDMLKGTSVEFHGPEFKGSKGLE